MLKPKTACSTQLLEGHCNRQQTLYGAAPGLREVIDDQIYTMLASQACKYCASLELSQKPAPCSWFQFFPGEWITCLYVWIEELGGAYRVTI